MRRLAAIAIALFIAACASTQGKALPPEKLYFAVELRHDGKLVGKPKLLGETGRVVRVEKRQQGATIPDYQLRLTPERDGEERFRIELDAAVRDSRGHRELALLHGQEKKLELGKFPGDLEVSLTLMKVDSPEFRALMGLVEAEQTARAPSAI